MNPIIPGLVRPLLAGLIACLGLGTFVAWNWVMLSEWDRQETQRRFDLNVDALGQRVQARMRAYEIVLRGVASAFAGDDHQVSPEQWREIVDQLRVQDLFPGISSMSWSRYVARDQLPGFEAAVRAAGRPDFRVFPAGERSHYLVLEYIGPVNERTTRVLGLDLFTQNPQQRATMRAIDAGSVAISRPVLDLYAVSPEEGDRVGVLMYFPVYTSGTPPATVEARRAHLLGVATAAFRGDELINGIFGPVLPLFQVTATDVDTGLPVFDSRAQHPVTTAPGWQPRFSGQQDLDVHGRTWRLQVASTPLYEQGLLARAQNLLLFVGMATALGLGIAVGAYVFQRDRQMLASEQLTARLREQARQLVLSNRYKSEFLANMSHELRTPLNSILILSDQMRQTALEDHREKQAHHADIVYRAGSDLLQLINDVLDLAKVESGHMQITLEPLSLQEVLIDLDAALRPLAEAKQLHLHIAQITADSGVPLRVFSDRVRLHQILRNLLTNAIKFTDAGQVNLGVSAESATPAPADGSVLVTFAVHDTGIGIAPEHQAQVFDAFQQVDGSTRRRFGGTGLGLAITRQLVAALEGDISLESAPGRGSTFTVSIPMRAVPGVALDALPAPVRTGSGPTVLVVEDDGVFASAVTRQAHGHGFSCVHCVTGQQALELLKSETFAAVILDLLLPDMSGWQLFRRLRALPAQRQTLVHIISSMNQPEGLPQQDHHVHYLNKPIAQNVLEQLFATLAQDAAHTNEPALLLVEDVKAEREHYRKQLEALGFAVTVCATGAEARTVWEDTPFDVLVVDLNLPDGDGFTLLEQLHALRSLQGVRVVVNTGVDLTQEKLQRLRHYSAVVVHKRGADTALLERAVGGFLGLLNPAGQDAGAMPVAAADALKSQLDGRRVLLADDDVRNVYAMSAALDRLGLVVSVAGNGEEAIASFLANPPELILMDMSMPVMDGYAATHALKQEHGCTVPIVALTAHVMKGDREKCLAAGCDDYLAKPVQKEELRAMLVRWLVDLHNTPSELFKPHTP